MAADDAARVGIEAVVGDEGPVGAAQIASTPTACLKIYMKAPTSNMLSGDLTNDIKQNRAKNS